MRQVDEDGALIKNKYSLMKQQETKVLDLEEDNHQSEYCCFKEIIDKDIIKADTRSLVAKVNMEKNNDIGEMKNLALEIQIK